MSKSFKSGVIGLALSISAALPAAALPIAFYDATIDATLSLTGVTVSSGTGDVDVDISGESFISDEDANSDGDATGAKNGAVSPTSFTSLDVEPITVQLSATGSATGIGFADSFMAADSFVDIFNFSPDNTVRVDFQLEYDLTAIAAVSDAGLQVAEASTFFSLQNSQDFDPLVEFDLLANTDFAELGGTISDILTFSIFVAPEADASLFLTAIVLGNLDSALEAPTAVPVPGMAALFALGAFGLCLKGRRKKSA